MLKKTKAILALDILLIAIMLIGSAASPSHSVGPYALSGATVQASQINGSGGGYASTNSTGQYVINKNIDVGNYTVEARSDGFISATENVTVESTSDTKVVDFYLNRSAIIVGRVMGFDGKPLVAAIVSLYDNSTGGFVDSTTTDSDGRYYFATGIDTGVYYIQITGFSYLYVSPLFSHIDIPELSSGNGYVSGVKSAPISATAGSTATMPDIILYKSGVITGTIMDGQGNPLADVSVSAFSSSPPYHYLSVTSNATGGYSLFYDIANATYTVMPSLLGYVADSINVHAVQGMTVVQNLTMTKSATVQGTLLRMSDNKPIPDASVDLGSTNYKYFGSDTTAENGSYKIAYGLGAANYTVTVYLHGEVLNTTSITLTAGENLTLNFLADAYFISGIVYNETLGGERVQYPYVTWSFEGFLPGGYASGDVNGTYNLALPVITGLKGMPFNGTFTVSASGYNTTEVNDTLTIGTDRTIDFVLFPQGPPPPPPPSASIIGTVYGNAGPPLPFSHQVWYMVSTTQYEGISTFIMEVNATSSITFLSTSITAGTVSIYVWGPEGTTGDMTVWIPKDLFPGPTFTVTSYPGPNPTPSLSSNATHWIVTIQYGHSSKYIMFQSENAIPEYTGPMILIAMLFTGTAIVLMERKRRTQKP